MSNDFLAEFDALVHAAFADALANAENIGLVFGSAGGRGHGVYAAPGSRFIFTSLAVE